MAIMMPMSEAGTATGSTHKHTHLLPTRGIIGLIYLFMGQAKIDKL